MNKFLMLAGAALLVSTSTAVAKPEGHGGGHKTTHATAKHTAKGSTMRSRHGVKPLAAYHGRAIVDRNRNGIWDRDEALARRYGGALCPPGLAKKPTSCMPPGQAKRTFREGQRLSSNYRYYTPYGNIPLALRERYDLSDDYRYVYRNNVIYMVDPATRAVTNIINAIL
jgi:hypothetical protein